MLQNGLVNILLTAFSATRSNYILRCLRDIRDLLCSEQLLAKPEFMHCVSGLTYDVLSGNLGMALRPPVPKVKSCGNFSDIILHFGEYHCSDRQ